MVVQLKGKRQAVGILAKPTSVSVLRGGRPEVQRFPLRSSFCGVSARRLVSSFQSLPFLSSLENSPFGYAIDYSLQLHYRICTTSANKVRCLQNLRT